MKILVTGGAGFIGSHLVDRLLALGHDVRVFDNLEPQVHGPDAKIPAHLPKEVEFVLGDLRDRDKLAAAMRDVEVIFHEGAAVGIGQSMYQVRKYIDVNCVGTATLLDIVVNDKTKVGKLILASSFSNYGEGRYACPRCGPLTPKLRTPDDTKGGQWELRCPKCRAELAAIPTDEDKPLFPTSIYATSKRDQEEMFLQIGEAYRIPTAVFRYFNIYGARQALNNPYTGIIAIFSSAILSGRTPTIFEDGRQSRDFTNVADVVAANLSALERHHVGAEVFNLGTGVATDLVTLYGLLYRTLKGQEPPPLEPSRKFRVGDIRHCRADLARIRTKLGYEPSVSLRDGLSGIREWILSQKVDERAPDALRELAAHGLVR